MKNSKLQNFLRSLSPNYRRNIPNHSAEEIVNRIRAEYTVMPRFMFHQPLDYNQVTLPIKAIRPTPSMPKLPEPEFRFGYATQDDVLYEEWGKYDFEMLRGIMDKFLVKQEDISVLDFGCSSGRVLRHFVNEYNNRWHLFGCDIQAAAIESMRADNWLKDVTFFANTTLPHLPLPSNSIDFIYSFSVFTHTKYLWDSWLMELNRVLKPGGVMMHTVHLEQAWEFYYKNKNESWVRENHHEMVYGNPHMNVDYLFYGDATVSQVFWKEEVLRNYWSRYCRVLDILPPTEKFSFQDRVILAKKA